METFEQAYKKLNPRQREAVDAIEGPVMVIAGPGTGKTQILTLRIANILLKTDMKPGGILALTFTESATANMRQRLVSLIGTPGYYVGISTFHGFANDLIQQYPEHFPGIIGARNAAEVDQIQIVRRIVEEGVVTSDDPAAPDGGADGKGGGEPRAFEHLRPFGDIFYHVPDILGAIKSVKNEGLTPEEFSELLDAEEERLNNIPDLKHEKGKYAGRMKGEYEKEFATLAKNRELVEIYKEYEKRLKEARLYDFADMILSVIRAFEARPQFLLQIQERYQYFLVDEHQDTNGAQNRLLELLASYYDAPNLFVVGDEKQAIFRFQGASLENFLYFQNKYPEAKVIYLESNYRSYQHILDSAGSLIEKNTTVLKHDLKAARGEAPQRAKPSEVEKKGARHNIQVLALRTPEAEQFAIAEVIKEKIAAGTPPGEIAVLYRLNRDAASLADMLSRRGIAYTIESDRDVLEDQDIKNILLLLEIIADFGNDEKLAEALHLDFFSPGLKLEPLEIYKLVSGHGEKHGGEKRGGKEGFESGRQSLYDRVMKVPLGKKLAQWKTDSVNKNFLNFFEDVMKESGFLDKILTGQGGAPDASGAGQSANFDKVSALTALFNEMKRTVGEHGEYRLKDFMRHLEVIREHHLPIKGPVRTGEKAVRLMTAHKAKGLEFDVVIVTGATDGHWGNRRDPARFKLPFKTSVDAAVIEKNEDERRLFYMALTRARNELYLTYAREREDGKQEVPSQFLGEIREDLRQEASAEEIEKYEKKLEGARLALIAPVRAARPLSAEQEFLRELFKKRGLSATALNNYLECPWRYFYINLLRIPQLPNLNQIYGIAVHAALENFFSAKKRGEPVGREFLIDGFAWALKRHPLTEKDFVALLAKGKKTLAAYHDHYADSWNYNVATELKVKVPFGVDGDEIILRGALDKLELQTDPHEVIVVDYKTRSPKSRNWILGETADSEGNYHRQLVFYRLLLDASPELGYRMRAGQIDFVEPNERGIFKKEEFVISEAQVGELRETVARVTREIKDFAFWDKDCGDGGCKWCGLSKI